MKYRSEIDGLRAIAVVPVMLFHAGFELFSGGFVGVDVFFVISGYLITTIIITELDVGKFSLLNFYERRARRILPSLFFVVLCSIPFAWLLLLPSDMRNFAQSLVAVSTFSSNVLFWLESGYFDTATELKPLLHTWSLAVEEQFYILFPLFLMAAWRLSKRAIVWTLIASFVVSLAAAHWGAYNKPAATFFLLPTRAWELLIGSFAAFYLKRKEVSAPLWLSDLMSAVGLAAILFAVFAFDETTPFPSLYALVPTVGTALIILFAVKRTWTHKLLSLRGLVGVGLISYSLYLWHQPVFAFWRHYNVFEGTHTQMLWLSLLCVPLAAFTYRFVEAPFRGKKSLLGRKDFFSSSVIVLSGVVIFGAVGFETDGFSNRIKGLDAIKATMINSVEAKSCFDVVGAHEAEDWVCRLYNSNNDARPEHRILVIGDSHAYSLYPAFESIAEQHNVEIFFVGYSGCVPLIGTHALRGDQQEKNCNSLNRRALEFASSNSLDTIVLIARWDYYTAGGYGGDNFSFISKGSNGSRAASSSRDAFEFGVGETVESYSRYGIRLVAIDQVPLQLHSPEYIYSQFLKARSSASANGLSQFSVPVHEFNRLAHFYRDTFSRYGLELVTINDFFCDGNWCSVGTTEESYYVDNDHLSIYGARAVSDLIWRRVFE